jgi:biotin-(acetyl-CoA carboxylase) ligase
MNFEKELEDIATSIKREYHVAIDREELITKFCNELEKNIDRRIGG